MEWIESKNGSKSSWLKSIENQNFPSNFNFKIQIVVKSSSEFVEIQFQIVDNSIWEP